MKTVKNASKLFGGSGVGKKQSSQSVAADDAIDNTSFTGTSLADLLAYLDAGKQMHPRDLHRAIKRFYPDIPTDDTQEGCRTLDEEWEMESRARQQQQKERGAAMAGLIDTIRKTPDPTPAFLDQLARIGLPKMTAAEYAEKRKLLLAKS